EADDDEIDGRNAMAVEGGHVLRNVPAGQNAAVDPGMEGLDAPVEHLRKLRDLGDVSHRDARIAQQPRRAARGEDLDASLGQLAREVGDAGLVVDADEGPTHGRHGRTSTRRPDTESRPSANSRMASG